MRLLEFIKRFPNEEACKKHLKIFREKQGIVCTRCGCVHHYWKGYRNQWECKQCGHRTTLTLLQQQEYGYIRQTNDCRCQLPKYLHA